VALAVAGILAATAAHAEDKDGSEASQPVAELEEVTVTATGRAQSAVDVPYNLSVVTGKDLSDAGISDLAGLSREVPGLTYLDLGPRSNGINNGLIIRGLNGASAGVNDNSPPASDTTVSTYINQTPLFSNLKITDVARVEVLRGPQGTLYGAGSVGGTVRFIFNPPDPTRFSGDVDARISKTEGSGDPSYDVDAILNIPLTDRAAVRISAGYEDRAGVIDAKNLAVYDSAGNPVLANPSDYFGSKGVFTRRPDVDNSNTKYARVSGLWNVTDSLSALLTMQAQFDNAGDFNGVSIHTDELEQTRFRTSPSHTHTDLYSLELTQDFGFATLTSATSYTRSILDSSSDYTNYALEFQSYYAGFPRITDYTNINYHTNQRSQEFRLISKPGTRWDWVAGAYYSKQEQTANIRTVIPGWSQYVNAPGNPDAVAVLGPGATYAQLLRTVYPDATFDSDSTFSLDKHVKNPQKALYGELTRHLTDRWQITGGVRFFWLNNDRSANQAYPAEGSLGNFLAVTNSASHDHIFKLNSSYEFMTSNQVYATYSEGFRQGGANALPLVGFFASDPALVPYKPDFSKNYEVGVKGQISHRIQYSAAAFLINWKDIQIQIPAPISGIPTLVNGGTAVSKGIELSANAAITSQLSATLGYTFTDAHLTESFSVRAGYNGNDGDRLPGVPRQSILAALDYNQPLSWGNTPSSVDFRVDGNYRSDTNTSLNPSSENFIHLGGFANFGASATWRREAVRVRLFVDNLTNNRGITAADIQNDTADLTRPGSIYFIQRPRTAGIDVGYSF
jgi:outer membrane receptor protein involved in Fe transport